MVVIPPHNLGPNSGKWGSVITKLLNELLNKSASAQQTAERAVKSANDIFSAVVQTNNELTNTQNDIKDGSRIPDEPQNVITTTANAWDALGNPAPSITVTWDVVNTDVNSAALGVASYEVWWKTGSAAYVPNADGNPTDLVDSTKYQRLNAVHSPLLTTVVQSNTTYSFIVRAISTTGTNGAFSAASDITSVTAGSTIPAPTTPTVSQNVGVVSVIWDGNFVSGGTPSYFRYVKVLQAVGSPTGTYSDTGQTLSGEGGAAISGLVDGTSYYYKFQAVDSAGSASGLSAASAAIVPEGVDLSGINDQIDAINDELAQPLDDSRFAAGSLTVWPFQNNTVPSGALQPGAVGSSDIADFAITARKFNDNRHHLF